MCPRRAVVYVLALSALAHVSIAARVPLGVYHSAELVADSQSQERAAESSSAEQQTEQQQSHSTFGDYYYYQDELTTADDAASGADGYGAPAEQRNTYVLEDSAGRMSVVEQESRALPGGGMVSWVRQTAPDLESVTLVSTSSDRDSFIDGSSSMHGTAGSFSLVQQVTDNAFLGSLGSVFAPLNDLLDALEAQPQQILGNIAASAHRHGPMMVQNMQQVLGPQYPLSHDQLSSGEPCPMHQAMIAATAAEAHIAAVAAAESQQQEQQHLDIFEQYAAQQHADMQQQVQHARLQSLLEENGLRLVDSLVVPWHDTAAIQFDAELASFTPGLEEVYEEYIDDSTPAADDYYVMDGSSIFDINMADQLSDKQALYSSWSKPSSSWWSAINPVADVDLDLALLVLLVACTAGMCIAFLQSLFQLRDVLHRQAATISSSKILSIAGRKPAALSAMAAGCCCCCANRKDSTGATNEGLRQPLLEQQEQPAAAVGVQSFYNPLCYQPLSGKM